MELLIVIAIIGILVTIVLIAIDPVRVIQNSQDTKRRAEMNQIKTALQMYFNDNRDYPASGTPTLTAGLVPTYVRGQLPGVTAVTSFNYTKISTTDYRASVPVNHTTGDDTDSVTKCSGPANSYSVCPD